MLDKVYDLVLEITDKQMKTTFTEVASVPAEGEKSAKLIALNLAQSVWGKSTYDIVVKSCTVRK